MDLEMPEVADFFCRCSLRDGVANDNSLENIYV